jgi:hypothetical protein
MPSVASTTRRDWMSCHRGGRRGVARALTNEVLARAEHRVELEVLDGNSAARALYESLGFGSESSTTGKLTGNESSQTTGHTLVWHRPEL